MGKGQVEKHAIPLKLGTLDRKSRQREKNRKFLAISYSVYFRFSKFHPPGHRILSISAILYIFERVRSRFSDWDEKSFSSGSSRKRNKSVFKHQRDE